MIQAKECLHNTFMAISRVGSDETLAIGEWYRILLIESDRFKNMQAFSLSIDLFNIATGKRLVQSQLSAEEALRLARKITPRQHEIETIADTIILREPGHIAIRRSFRLGNLNVLSGPQLSRADQAVLRERMNRGRPYCGGSSALEAWSRYRWTAHPHVIIVGSGLGGCAVSLFRQGCRSLEGHDLRKDLSSDPESIISYCPPLVYQFGFEDYYVQTSESTSTEGDWFQANVHGSILQRLQEGSLLVFDIKDHSKVVAAVLDPLCSHRAKVDASVRVLCHRSEAHYLLGLCASSGTSAKIQILRESGPMVDVSVDISGPFIVPAELLGCTIEWPIFTDTIDSYLLGSDYINNVVFGPVGGNLGRTLRESCAYALETIESEIGQYAYRPSYFEWSSLLRLGVACHWILAPDDRKESYLRTYCETGYATLVIGRNQHKVMFTTASERLITNMITRLQ